MKKKTKIWLGVGAFVVAGGSTAIPAWSTADARALPDFSDASTRCAPAAPANYVFAQAAAPHGAGHPAAQGGEGGEGGEGGATNLPPDLTFYRTIALIRGHLLIGDELVSQKQWVAAYPHFMHPTEELYDLIKDTVKDYNVKPFDKALKSLAQAVKAKDSKKYAASLKAVQAALASADAGVKPKQAANWDSFSFAAALEALKVATAEYTAAFKDGKLVNPVEYQDARGFIFHADAMIAAVAPGLEKKNADALKKIRADIADLKLAFPTAMPPKAPIKDAATVSSTVSRIELAAGPLL
ncbi:MAG: hypothetical protein Q7T81_07140 [Pseudolabrys sp.]|nr:hypothetical protein [Pseudolabrys sp.]